jgi:hypothetical protein
MEQRGRSFSRPSTDVPEHDLKAEAPALRNMSISSRGLTRACSWQALLR